MYHLERHRPAMNEARTMGNEISVRNWPVCPKILGPRSVYAAARILVLSWLLAPVGQAGFYDPTVGDQAKTYAYLENVEATVGTERFEAIPYDYALSLAQTFGMIDRTDVTSEVFATHVMKVSELERRFYNERPLSGDEVKAWLLPHRLRYEIRTKADWLPTLAKRFGRVADGAKSADDAAARILDWLTAHLEVMLPTESYLLPQRGDLDPMTVLKGGRGTEVDVAMCGVAALRSAGVAARLVWAPALRAEAGGKMWLEYLREDRTWTPWVPSFGKAKDHAAEIRRRLGEKIVFVMARPEAPLEVTESYADTVEIAFNSTQEGTDIGLMILGKAGLLPARGMEIEDAKCERLVKIGRGPIIITASFGNRAFALLPVEILPDTQTMVVDAEDGELRVGTRTAR